MSDQILAKIKLWPQKDRLPCAVAHYIASELGISPQQVGEVADQENGARITQCQLGLFGYAKKGTPTYKILKPMDPMPEALKQAIDAAAHGQLANKPLYPNSLFPSERSGPIPRRPRRKPRLLRTHPGVSLTSMEGWGGNVSAPAPYRPGAACAGRHSRNPLYSSQYEALFDS